MKLRCYTNRHNLNELLASWVIKPKPCFTKYYQDVSCQCEAGVLLFGAELDVELVRSVAERPESFPVGLLLDVPTLPQGCIAFGEDGERIDVVPDKDCEIPPAVAYIPGPVSLGWLREIGFFSGRERKEYSARRFAEVPQVSELLAVWEPGSNRLRPPLNRIVDAVRQADAGSSVVTVTRDMASLDKLMGCVAAMRSAIVPAVGPKAVADFIYLMIACGRSKTQEGKRAQAHYIRSQFTDWVPSEIACLPHVIAASEDQSWQKILASAVEELGRPEDVEDVNLLAWIGTARRMMSHSPNDIDGVKFLSELQTALDAELRALPAKAAAKSRKTLEKAFENARLILSSELTLGEIRRIPPECVAIRALVQVLRHPDHEDVVASWADFRDHGMTRREYALACLLSAGRSGFQRMQGERKSQCRDLDPVFRAMTSARVALWTSANLEVAFTFTDSLIADTVSETHTMVIDGVCGSKLTVQHRDNFDDVAVFLPVGFGKIPKQVLAEFVKALNWEDCTETSTLFAKVREIRLFNFLTLRFHTQDADAPANEASPGTGRFEISWGAPKVGGHHGIVQVIASTCPTVSTVVDVPALTRRWGECRHEVAWDDIPVEVKRSLRKHLEPK
ncbi:MAG: hypothetical protein K8T26_10890 [Lentisphaerae bacterium]|nr:hypothetical protein [Lentisphaerota bacterium]